MRDRRLAIFRLVLGFLVLAGATSLADVKPHALFSDHMVMQQGKAVAVWGKADPGEQVAVEFAGQKKAATADAKGCWKVVLDPMPASTEPRTMTITGSSQDQKSQIGDVLVGEVWVCSGQSNMAMQVTACANAEEEIANSKNPLIRLFTVPRKVSQEPLQEIESSWQECGPETVGGFSAVGYFFGRELQKALQVPVGLIHTSWGGTPAEAWTSRPTLEADPVLREILEGYAEALKMLPQAMERHKAALEQQKEKVAKWREFAAKEKKEGRPVPNMPRPPRPPLGPDSPHSPSGLYNGMIAPLLPYAIQGAIWYQGESNAGRAYQYRTLFPAMIKDWRKSWGQGDLPFLFVQLAPLTKPSEEPGESDWAELREAQLMTLSLPNTGMAVITDVGDPDNIHPKKKQEVGARLALAARALACGEKIVYSGPTYDSMKVEGRKAVLSFKHVGKGLIVKDGDLMPHDGKLKGFTIAGSDKVFHNAEAEIQGDKVIVSSPDVPKPVAVRCGWAKYPLVNLYNCEGLPASPFRTDDWPGVTQPK